MFLTLSFTSIRSLFSTFISYDFFLESNFLDILALVRETLLRTPLLNFSVKGYLPLISKDSVTQIHSLAVYVNKRFWFAHDLSLENS